MRTFEKINGVEVQYKVAPRRPGDVEISFAAVDKARELLHWQTKYKLEDCLRDAWNFKVHKDE